MISADAISLIDREEERILRAVLVGMLCEMTHGYHLGGDASGTEVRRVDGDVEG